MSKVQIGVIVTIYSDESVMYFMKEILLCTVMCVLGRE